MKINMRLTAWIFGLFVITDLAGRVMRGRSRGKGAARIKLIAFGIFVAGSVGMLAGRLLQAAVSRRREHLADASSVQFTRNPQALQSAFVIMAASAEGTRSSTSRPPTWRTCSSPAAMPPGRRSSAARCSPRIRRSRNACVHSIRACHHPRFKIAISEERRRRAPRRKPKPKQPPLSRAVPKHPLKPAPPCLSPRARPRCRPLCLWRQCPWRHGRRASCRRAFEAGGHQWRPARTQHRRPEPGDVRRARPHWRRRCPRVSAWWRARHCLPTCCAID